MARLSKRKLALASALTREEDILVLMADFAQDLRMQVGRVGDMLSYVRQRAAERQRFLIWLREQEGLPPSECNDPIVV